MTAAYSTKAVGCDHTDPQIPVAALRLFWLKSQHATGGTGIDRAGETPSASQM